jgi:hypothetical protein
LALSLAAMLSWPLVLPLAHLAWPLALVLALALPY